MGSDRANFISAFGDGNVALAIVRQKLIAGIQSRKGSITFSNDAITVNLPPPQNTMIVKLNSVSEVRALFYLARTLGVDLTEHVNGDQDIISAHFPDGVSHTAQLGIDLLRQEAGIPEANEPMILESDPITSTFQSDVDLILPDELDEPSELDSGMIPTVGSEFYLPRG